MHRLNKRFHDGERDHIILRELEFEMAAEEVVAIVGPSGSGKSSLLNIVGGLDHDFSGFVQVLGCELRSMNSKALARFRNQQLGFVFQAYNLLGQLTVLENTMLASYFSKNKPDKTRALEVLNRVGLSSKWRRKPGELSGGERQRVAIARALYHRPALVLCDEPTGNLDGETAMQIIALLQEVNRQGSALLIATHDHKIAEKAHRILALRSGKLVEEGSHNKGILA
jgi:putative ABC transport system ATP-binding protein